MRTPRELEKKKYKVSNNSSSNHFSRPNLSNTLGLLHLKIVYIYWVRSLSETCLMSNGKIKKNGFRQSNRRPASCIGSQVEPRPFLEISAQDQLRTKITKKNSRTAVVSMRSAGGRVQEPPSPHLQFRYPHCVPILMPMVLDRSHNLRMVREGRTNVTILV